MTANIHLGHAPTKLTS